MANPGTGPRFGSLSITCIPFIEKDLEEWRMKRLRYTNEHENKTKTLPDA